MHDAVFEQTLSSIYDAALEPARWTGALADMAGLFHAGFADRFARTHDRSRHSGVAHGLDVADYQELFLGSWSKRNVWSQRRPVKEAGEIITTREILAKEELVRSEMYAEYLRERGLHEGMRLAIWSGEEGIEDISLLRPFSIGPYTAAERDTAALLMPHLRRAAALSRRLMQAEVASVADRMALESLNQAVVMLDAGGRIVYANGAAWRHFARGDGLVPGAAGVSAPAADESLQRAIRLAARPRAEARSATVRVPQPVGRQALVVTTVPVASPWRWFEHEQPRVLLSIIDPALDVGARRAHVQEVFGLTTAEAALAEALANGEEMAAIARRTGRSLATVRTHLARLMAKTGTARQVELVRLLLGLPGLGE